MARKIDMKEANEIHIAGVDSHIHLIRGQRVMLDSELATLYGVNTKRLNEQVKRNQKRFPRQFAFRLSQQELAGLRSQIATSKGRGGRRYLPLVFTEHGAVMLATVLNSPTAIQASVRIVEAFVRLRRLFETNRELVGKVEDLRARVTFHDKAIAVLFDEIKKLAEPPEEPPPTRRIGFRRPGEAG